jgi:hypothetical protein
MVVQMQHKILYITMQIRLSFALDAITALCIPSPKEMAQKQHFRALNGKFPQIKKS